MPDNLIGDLCKLPRQKAITLLQYCRLHFANEETEAHRALVTLPIGYI